MHKGMPVTIVKLGKHARKFFITKCACGYFKLGKHWLKNIRLSTRAN